MNAAPAGPARDDIRVRMDRMYRPQVAVYDLTRRHYLLGRDRLIRELGARPGERVLEVGCGTGRNLVAVGRACPGVELTGLDAAAPMLERARASLSRAGLGARLVRGVAEDLDGAGLRGLDHVVISYCLSMVDDPRLALEKALAALRPGGTLHVVDFADAARLPAPFRRALAGWLALFGVRYRPEVEASLIEAERRGEGRLDVAEIAGRYALLLRFSKAPGA